ncbi:MAG: two-component regulator propeller domain-containing protein [Bacteroidales bacterium]
MYNSNIVTNVFESLLHGLWIITDLGLFLYDYKSGSISRHAYDPDKGDILRSQDINSFYESPDGIAWVGTWQGGLSRYDVASGDIKTYTTNDGLPSMSIQGILGDEKNQALWLSTFNGISRFSLPDEQFNNFSLKDGIQGLLYADGQYIKTSSGYFLFGGNNGMLLLQAGRYFPEFNATGHLYLSF